MASLDRQFRALLRSHLERTGTSGRRFGVEALKDPGFAASLAGGRRLGLKTVDTLLAFMGYPPLGAAFRREVEAFLRVTGTKAYVLGEVVLNDATFVDRLRRGASLRLAAVEKVRAWMAGQACGGGPCRDARGDCGRAASVGRRPVRRLRRNGRSRHEE